MFKSRLALCGILGLLLVPSIGFGQCQKGQQPPTGSGGPSALPRMTPLTSPTPQSQVQLNQFVQQRQMQVMLQQQRLQQQQFLQQQQRMQQSLVYQQQLMLQNLLAQPDDVLRQTLSHTNAYVRMVATQELARRQSSAGQLVPSQ
jgi:hypothetical protein